LPGNLKSSYLNDNCFFGFLSICFLCDLFQ